MCKLCDMTDGGKLPEVQKVEIDGVDIAPLLREIGQETSDPEAFIKMFMFFATMKSLVEIARLSEGLRDIFGDSLGFDMPSGNDPDDPFGLRGGRPLS